jgi:hypothetical protein
MKQGDRWIVFYTDGSTFSSADGTPWDAPRIGVQCVASCKDEQERDWYTIQQVEGYYYEKDRGGWLEFENERTFWLHFFRATHPCAVFGEMVTDSKWRSLFERITDYCEQNREWLLGLTDERPASKYL